MTSFSWFLLALSITACGFACAVLVAALRLPREARFGDSVSRRGLWIALAIVLLFPNLSVAMGLAQDPGLIDLAGGLLSSMVTAATVAGLTLRSSASTSIDDGRDGDAAAVQSRTASGLRWVLLLHGCFACELLALHAFNAFAITCLSPGLRFQIWATRATGPFSMFRTEPVWFASAFVVACVVVIVLGIAYRGSTWLRRLGYFAWVAWFYCGDFGARDLP